MTKAGRLVARAKMLGSFASIQAFAQAIGVVSGLLLVRTLSRSEYAFFTIINSVQSTMALLADTGLSIGLSSIGGNVWRDRHRFGQLVATTMHLRRYLAGAATAIVTPILVWVLISNGCSHAATAALTVAALVGFSFQIRTGVLVMVPRLLSQIGRVQAADVVSATARLALVVVAYVVFLNAVTAVAASVVALALQYFLVRRWVARDIDLHAPIHEEDRKALLRIVKQAIPTTVFHCLQGQIVVWLMTIVGSTQSVAEVGALGRLSILFSIIVSVMTTIVVPHFARCQEAWLLRRRFVQVTAGFTAFGAALILFAALFPDALLWILGAKYALLHRELVLMMTFTAVNSISGAMWSLNSSKAWIEYVWLHIPSTLLMQAVLLMTVNVSTLQGALWFGTFSVLPSIVLNAVLAVRGLRSAARTVSTPP